MAIPASIREPRIGESAEARSETPSWARAEYALYALALAASISIWFLAVRAPLWLDETGSYWQISQGFWRIPARHGGLSFPAYAYILWFATKILGTSEIALRVPSILAMLGAVYLLYRAARELFGPDVAFITAAMFAIHPIVVFAAIDVRPYAFAALAVNATILLLVRLRPAPSTLLAVLIGVSGAVILYFHFLFGVILPVVFVCLAALVIGLGRATWRQLALALAAFGVAFLPVIPGLLYMFRTRATHVFESAPTLEELRWTLVPGFPNSILQSGWTLAIFAVVLLAAAALRRLDLERRLDGWILLVCVSLGFVPILVLYGVSAYTPIHIFTERHRLVAIPGIALCWGLLMSRIDSRALRVLFCVVVVAGTVCKYYSAPYSGRHGYTWKYALEAAEKSAWPDRAPILICSDLPESDYETMPVDNPKGSNLFVPLSYYKVSVPVIPLPRALNAEAIRVASSFLHDPARRRQRFLAMGFGPSYPTLDWLVRQASATHEVRILGQFSGIAVLEFVPRS